MRGRLTSNLVSNGADEATLLCYCSGDILRVGAMVGGSIVGPSVGPKDGALDGPQLG